MTFLDRNQRIPLRGLNAIAAKANQGAMPAGGGVDIMQLGAVPVSSPSPRRARYCTARITGIAMNEGSPLLDNNGNEQYTWLEEERVFSGGYAKWQDATFDGARGSVDAGGGVFYNLAKEANGATAIIGEHVIMWATVQNNDTSTPAETKGIEHVFYAGAVGPVETSSGSTIYRSCIPDPRAPILSGPAYVWGQDMSGNCGWVPTEVCSG